MQDEVLEFCSVMLQNTLDKSAQGVNTDSLGQFEFEGVAPGTYLLTINYVGYNKKEQTVVVEGTDQDVRLGAINMSTNGMQLNEVQIVDFRQLVEQKPDGIVYNAEKDISNKGTTAEQLLRKVPMLTVDLEGNVQLRGSGNIKVLIDGKPSSLIAATVKDAIKQIPADNIKSVEVITSPGAKYDGEGAAGVINIITKKNLMKGLSGSIMGNMAYNIPVEIYTGYGSFNLNYRNKNLSLAFNAGYSRWEMLVRNSSKRSNLDQLGNELLLTQEGSFKGKGDFFWSHLTADYQIDSLQSFQASLNYNPGTWQDIRETNTRINGGIAALEHTNTSYPRQNYGISAAYSKKFKDNPKRTLDVLGQFSSNNPKGEYDLERSPGNGLPIDYKERHRPVSNNNELALQADYVHPLKSNNQKIEVGAKFVNRDIGTRFNVYTWITGEPDFSLDPSRSDRLDYTQNVGAAYGQFSSQLSPMLSMVVGLRYEYTGIDGKQTAEDSHFTSHFNSLLPNLSFSYTLKNYSKLKLAYNKRIERPSIDYINPYKKYEGIYNVTYGNPDLEPENTHNVELGYSTYFKNTSLNIAAFYRHNGNAIEAVTEVDNNDVSRTTYRNIARNNSMGANLFAGTTLFGKWMINLNGSAYYSMFNSKALDTKNEGWAFSGNMYSSYKISERFSVAGYGMYNGSTITLQGSQSSWYYYFLGLQATILKGKGTLMLAGENFFTPEVHMSTKYKYQNADYELKSIYYGRGLRLTFNWSFGKMQFIQKKTIDNNDLKSGGGQQGGGGMGGS